MKTEIDDVPNNLRECKKIMWKNTLCLSFGFFLHYIAYHAIIPIQSSLNSDQGLGTVALSVTTISCIVTALFATTSVLRRHGSKRTMVAGNMAFVAYIIANFYPAWGTLIPGSILAGIGYALMIVAHNTYLNKLTRWYALRIGAEVDSVSPKFFGVFTSIVFSSGIVGKMASSFILGLRTLSTDENVNRTVLYDALRTCGAQYCNEDLGTGFTKTAFRPVGNVTENPFSTSTSSRRPDTYRIYILCGFCVVSILLSLMLLILFLDNLKKLGITDGSERPGISRSKLVMATFIRLKDPKQLLLLPLTLYNGMDNYFLNVDFTKAFITCPLGVQYIGVITASSAAFSLASAFLGGWFNTKRTRWIPVTIALLTQLIPAIVMLQWIPSQNETILQFVLASSWGIGAGIISVQLNSYYGIVFADNVEPAMANFSLWHNVASAVLYGISHLLCIYIKIYLLMTVLIAGMVGFACVEVWILFVDNKMRKAKQQQESSVPMMTARDSH